MGGVRPSPQTEKAQPCGWAFSVCGDLSQPQSAALTAPIRVASDKQTVQWTFAAQQPAVAGTDQRPRCFDFLVKVSLTRMTRR